MSWCKTCGDYIYQSPRGVLEVGHQCPPVWMVWEPMNEDEDDATTIHERDDRGAAKAYRDNDPNDYDRADEITVSVRSSGGGLTTWCVSVEMEPSYTATEVKP